MAKEKKAPATPKVEVKAPEVQETPVKSTNNIVTVKIDPADIIQLQKDGRLMSYDPATGIGEVRETGLPTIWPDAEK